MGVMYCKVQISVESHDWTMAAFHNASATWWQHYIQHSFIKMMDMQSQIIKRLTSPVAHRQSRTLPAKFRILLTGNLDYGYTLDHQLLIADHCLLFPLMLIEKQLTSCPKLFSFPQWNISNISINASRPWSHGGTRTPLQADSHDVLSPYEVGMPDVLAHCHCLGLQILRRNIWIFSC